MGTQLCDFARAFAGNAPACNQAPRPFQELFVHRFHSSPAGCDRQRARVSIISPTGDQSEGQPTSTCLICWLGSSQSNQHVKISLDLVASAGARLLSILWESLVRLVRKLR